MITGLYREQNKMSTVLFPYNRSNESSTSRVNGNHENLYTTAKTFYVYIISFLFILVIIYNTFIACKYRKRILKQTTILTLIIYITIATTFDVFSVISAGSFHQKVREMFEGTAVPVFLNTFCLVQVVFLRLTRLDIKPLRVNNIACILITTSLVGLTMVMLGILRLVDVIDTNATIISDAYFVLYGSYLSICFVYSVPKLTQYANETQSARKEMSIQSISKRIESVTGSGQIQLPSRIKTPRIKYSGNMITLVCDAESSDSNDEGNNNISCTKNLPKAKQLQSKNQGDADVCKKDNLMTSQSKRTIRSGKTAADWSSDSNEDHHSAESCNDSPLFTFCRRLNSLKTEKAFAHQNHLPEPFSTSFSFPAKSDYADDLKIENLSTSDVPLYVTSENSSPVSVKSDYDFNKRKHRRQVDMCCRTFDSGYIADNEIISINSNYSEDRNSERETGSPFGVPLPNSLSFMSFYRLYQARILCLLIKITYVITVSIVMSIFFRIYKIVRASGQDSIDDEYSTVQWIVLSLERLLELLVLVLTSFSVHIVISHKFQRKRNFQRTR